MIIFIAGFIVGAAIALIFGIGILSWLGQKVILPW